MPSRRRASRDGAPKACCCLLIVCGVFVIISGVLVIFLQGDAVIGRTWVQLGDMKILGLCLLVFGALCLIIGFWLCSSVCRKENRRLRKRRKHSRSSNTRQTRTAAQNCPPSATLPLIPPSRPYPWPNPVTNPGPAPAQPYPVQGAGNVPFNPQFVPVSSASQPTSSVFLPSNLVPSAPPPTYDEAMSFNMI